MNIEILGISELKWTGMGECNSDNHYIFSVSVGKGLSILLNFSKSQHLVLLIFSFVFLLSIWLISTLFFVIFFLL